jgi:hypothetical protein
MINALASPRRKRANDVPVLIGHRRDVRWRSGDQPCVCPRLLDDLCLKSLATAHGLATDIAAWLQVSDDNLTQEQALAVSYAKFVEPHIALVDHQLENVVEISLRLFAKGEPQARSAGS